MRAVASNTVGPVMAAVVLAGAVTVATPGVARAADVAQEKAAMVFESPGRTRWHFSGPMGERIQAGIDGWLLTAPAANPGMVEMFRCRDRQPVPKLVPWAGEYVGKYLTSAILTCRLTDDTRLKALVSQVLAEFIATQAEDGYLGPFPRAERLLGHWDLWGHYHAMLALMLWYEDTGDAAALQCASRAADLIWRTFPASGRRLHSAGSQEMNLAVVHALGRLYRHTGEERYRRLLAEIEKDWELPPAGDYLRTGLTGVDFYRTPKPRWESLHDLQGLVELYRITGDERYRRAFVQHWTSIRNYDRHPSGGFTTGEQAIGNPYTAGAIETCCTIAWMALSVDMLQLTGDPSAADELELSTWNGMLGAQHPSGRWCTYSTPMDGVREASAHSIVFQARAGTPELNCCSVNGPRGVGMLSEWALLRDAEGLVLNYYGPSEIRTTLADGTPVGISQATNYPAEGDIRLTIALPQPTRLALRLRLPHWSRRTSVRLNGAAVPEPVTPGAYLSLSRVWSSDDVVELGMDMSLRSWSGELTRTGAAALFRGPLLLAFDQKFNSMDCAAMPALDLQALKAAPVAVSAVCMPLVALQFTASGGQTVTLCDFATAGVHGNDYRAWLPAVHAAPAPFHLRRPEAGARVGPGALAFEWTGYRSSAGAGRTFSLEIADAADLSRPLVSIPALRSLRAVVAPGILAPGHAYCWRVVAVGPHGETAAEDGWRNFAVAADLPPTAAELDLPGEPGPDGVLLRASLNGSPEPAFGVLEAAVDLVAVEGRTGAPASAVAGNGATSRLTYRIAYFPEADCTVCVWVCPEGPPVQRLQQVFSAWGAPMDDPLRLVVQNGEVSARLEAGRAYSTAGVPLVAGSWTHVAAVKQGDALHLYVNGKRWQSTAVPATVFSVAQNVGIGCNPNYSGNERFVGRLAEVAFWARALTAVEVMAACSRGTDHL